MIPLPLGLVPENLMDDWLPLGTVAAVVVAVVGFLWTAMQFMRRIERKHDALTNDIAKNRDDIRAEIAALRTDMQHRFERLEDHTQVYLRQRDFAAWVDRLRDSSPALKVPSAFDAD